MVILFVGAVSNVILNYYLIPVLGIEGAAVATLLGYIVALVLAIIVLTKMKLLKVSDRFYYSSLLMIIMMLCWRIIFKDNMMITVFMAVAGTLLIMLSYKDEVNYIVQIISRKRENGD